MNYKLLPLILFLFVWLTTAISALGQTYSSIITDKEIFDFLNWMTQTDQRHDEEPKLKRKQIYYKIETWEAANFIASDSTLIGEYKGERIYAYTPDQFLFHKISIAGTGSNGIDTMFKKTDRAFLFQQFTAIKDTIWHESFLNLRLLTGKNKQRTNRYYYSVPLFSPDRKYVIIRRIYYCGDLCAYGGYYIYKKVGKNKWEYITAVNEWVS